MSNDTAAWKTEDPAWVKQREVEWLKEGMPLITHMYQRGGDLDPEKAQAIKNYFLTGNYSDATGFPLFYRLRFYPGNSEEWLRNCIFQSLGFDVGRYIVMYKVDSMGSHNAALANILFSNQFESRLNEIELAEQWTRVGELIGRLDLAMIEKRCRSLIRTLRGMSEDDDTDHYFYHLGETWLDISLNFDRRSGFASETIVKKLQFLMEYSLETYFNKENDQEVIDLAQHTIELFDAKLNQGHELFEVWQAKKNEMGMGD